MTFKWKILKLTLYISLILSILSLIGWIIILIKLHQYQKITIENILSLVCFTIFIPFTLFLLWIIRKKIPAGIITNMIEGSTYLFAILVLIACLFLMAYDTTYLIAFFKSNVPLNVFVVLLNCLIFETAVLTLLYIYIGINAFLLISSISKKRLKTIREISEIGKS